MLVSGLSEACQPFKNRFSIPCNFSLPEGDPCRFSESSVLRAHHFFSRSKDLAPDIELKYL